MKRTVTLLAMIAMMTVLLLPQTGIAQDETPSDRQSARTMQMENRLLIAINSAGLSLEQLQTIHAGIAPIQTAKADAEAAQEAMHDFLVNWTGDAEAFEAAFEEIRATTQAAFENVRTQMEAFQETIGDTLTANQAEAFRAALGPQRGFGQNQGPRFGNRDGTPQQQQQGERGPRFGGPGMLGAIDVLDSVLSAKIEALQNQ